MRRAYHTCGGVIYLWCAMIAVEPEEQTTHGRTLHMREPMPQRRRLWTQRVTVGGQRVYLTVGEYPDGRPGEIFVDVAKQGTFLRGVMGALARMVSISLQCGAGVDVVVTALRGLDYPPNGKVEGSSVVVEALSVTDWIAAELEDRYMRPEPQAPEPTPEKVAGVDSTHWSGH